MAEETTGQETATDEFAGIDPDALASLLSGNAEEIDAAGEQNAEDAETTTTTPPDPAVTLTPEQIQQTIQAAVKEGVQAGQQTPTPPATQQGDFMTQYRETIQKNCVDNMGLKEDGAKFMTDFAMSVAQPLLQIMARGFQSVSQKSNEIETNTALSEVDRNLNSYLDAKKITDPSDRQDIMDLAKIRASQIQNPSTETLQIEFEKIAGKYLVKQQASEDEESTLAEQEETESPPAVKGGKIGFEDIIGKINKSTASEDDIGGSRFTSAVERMIAAGVQGGGQ